MRRRRMLGLLAGLAAGLVGGYAAGLVREPHAGDDADEGAAQAGEGG
ncbi:MAG: hypothetical protein ACJ74O_14320 [Frankiaceae bacterium]